MADRPIAYIASRYPALSHTFIEREVRGLRARGVGVETFTIRATDGSDLRTDVDREEAARTTAILPAGAASIACAHAGAFARSPLRYLRTLRTALRMGSGGLRATLWQLFYFAEAGLLLAGMRRRGIRHVHAHFANVASAVAMLAAGLGGRGFSWSFTMHGPTEFDDVIGYALAAKVRDARFVACIGDYCRSQLMKLVEPEHWDKLSIVRCGVDVERFSRVRRASHDGPLRVLCLGRLVPDKGQGILVEAIRRLRDDGTDVELTLAGDGPDRESVARMVDELGLGARVTLAGSVSQDEVLGLYRTADVFCLPSFAEGIPVVLMEAMATGLPVVTTRVMGIPELVRDGVDGVLVAPGRVDPIVDALRRLAGEERHRDEMGRSGSDRVHRVFDAEAGAAAMSDRLASITDA